MTVGNLMRAFIEAGGIPYFVGGKVRDAYMGVESNDNDIVVFGLPFAEVMRVAESHGRPTLTVVDGTGVIKLNMEDEIVDLIMPRRERSTGESDNDFTFEIDHTMHPHEERRRADFTMNAMIMSVDGNILDFFGGMEDIDNGIIRHIDPIRFVESPVRGLRAARFAARFNFRVASETSELIGTMNPSLIAPERVFAEFEKMFAQAVKPSRFVEVLFESGWLSHFPILADMIGVPQDSFWHPEGTVIVHTMHVMDVMAEIAPGDVALGFAAMLHDCGKPYTTEKRNGRIVSPGHAAAGSMLAQSFMTELRAPNAMIEEVWNLVNEHMALLDVEPSNHRAVRRLCHRLAQGGTTIERWAKLVEADHSGRPPLPRGNPAAPFVEAANNLNIEPSGPTPLVMGRHVLEFLSPGPEMGKLLRAAFEAQLDGEFDTVEAGVRWIRERMA